MRWLRSPANGTEIRLVRAGWQPWLKRTLTLHYNKQYIQMNRGWRKYSISMDTETSISYLLWMHYGRNLKKHCQRYMRWVLEQVYFSAAVESIFKHNKEWREFFIKVSLNYSSETSSCSLPSGTELQSPGVSPHFCEPSFPTSVSLSLSFSAGKNTHTRGAFMRRVLYVVV